MRTATNYNPAGIDQYLTFTLNDDLFACNVLNIKEVLEFTKIRKIPNTPDFIPGIINLRGVIVPVVDLRKKLNFTVKEYTPGTTIIIVEVEYQEETVLIGALVDSIKLVQRIDPEQLSPPPDRGINIDTDYITAIAEFEDDFILILDIEKIFSKQELSFLSDEYNEDGKAKF